MQKLCTCPQTTSFCCHSGWKVALVGSRFTFSAESRYAPVEGEALAVADALDKARYFVLGCQDLTVVVNHKPLLKILGDRSLEDLSNTRLRKLKEETLQYRFKMVYIPGVKHRATDRLSRYPTHQNDSITTFAHDDPLDMDPSDMQYLSVSFLADIRDIEPSDSIEACIIV